MIAKATKKAYSYTLENSFHGTSTTVRFAYPVEDPWMEIQMDANDGVTGAAQRLRRVRKALCGNKDCKCGTVR